MFRRREFECTELIVKITYEIRYFKLVLASDVLLTLAKEIDKLTAMLLNAREA